MIKKNIVNGLMLCFFLSCLVAVGQTRKERKADQNFEAFAYIDAIASYKKMVDQGLVNSSILSKLGDAYYFNGKFEEAFTWYDELFQGNYEGKDLSSLDREYYYRYGQTLKAVHQVEQADAILQKFASLENSDSRAQLWIPNEELVQQTLMASRYTLVNLSSNSAYSDYGATLLDNRLIFTSARLSEEMKNKVHNWTNQHYTKLYATTLSPDGSFSEPQLYAKEIASKELNMGTAIFTKDGRTLYFTSNNGATGKGKRAQYNEEESSLLKIYKASKQPDGSWGAVEALPFNQEGHNTAHPALTPDEKWMYFVSDRPGSIGQSDLFRVAVYETGRFGPIENLGDQINTAGRETFPFISSDYHLYFASNGHPGFGGLDLFRAKINLKGNLGVPVNLGPDINSAFDDFGLYFDAATRKGFVSSNRPGGNGGDDLYMFVEKNCFQLVDGLVTDLNSTQAIPYAQIEVYDQHEKLVEKAQADEQGYYQVTQLACGQTYQIQVSKPAYFTREFTIKADRKVQQHLHVKLELMKKGDDLFKKLELAPIHFDFDQWEIRLDAQVELGKVVEAMREHPSIKIDVRSHTDSRGNDTYNLTLSERRAQATKQWMINQGIDASRLSGQGYGESQLVNACENGVTCSESEHQENRRSEFIIVDME